MEKKSPVSKFIKNIFVKNILLMIATFVSLIVIILIVLNIYTRHNESIIVPPVKGLQVEEAIGILKSVDLYYEVVDSIYQSGVAPGAIIEQIPIEKSNVKVGRTVYLTIQAKGVEMIAIPELKDFSRRQAEAQLNSLGFEKIVIEEVPSAYADIVISVSYKGNPLTANQKVPKGVVLKMTVGAGGEQEGDSTLVNNDEIDQSFF